MQSVCLVFSDGLVRIWYQGISKHQWRHKRGAYQEFPDTNLEIWQSVLFSMTKTKGYPKLLSMRGPGKSKRRQNIRYPHFVYYHKTIRTSTRLLLLKFRFHRNIWIITKCWLCAHQAKGGGPSFFSWVCDKRCCVLERWCLYISLRPSDAYKRQ